MGSAGGSIAPPPWRVRVFHSVPAGGDTVVVVFSAVGAMRSGFHLLPVLGSLPAVSKLFVRDPRSSWYNAGLPGVGETPAEIAAAIERELEAFGAKRVVTIGPSMGAYAAILFGCLIGAERAVALAPQTLLDRGLRYAPPDDVGLQVPDLKPVVQAASGTAIDVVTPWDDLTDVFHARRIAGLPGVRVLALPNRLHWCGGQLLREGLFLPMIEALLDGGTPAICDVDPEIDPESEGGIAAAVYAEQRSDWRAVVEGIAPVAERYPGWPGPNYEHGRALAKLGDWQGAEAALVAALRENPGWAEARAELDRVQVAQG